MLFYPIQWMYRIKLIITRTDSCRENSIAMTSLNNNLKFECAFSQSAVRNNTIVVVVMSLLVIIPFGYLGIKLGGWIGIMLVLLFVGLSIYSLVYTNLLTHESYLEITEEGLLICKYKGCATVSFPIKEITSIESASLEQANERYAKVPVLLNSRGWELYPSEGVLITFNRKWIKSVFPVYFNPADIQGFISAVKRAKDSLNT